MRDQIATILFGLIIGGIVGGGGLYFVLRDNGQAKLVNGQPLSYWLKALGSDDANWRKSAAQVVPQFGSEAIEPVMKLLEDSRTQDGAVDVLAAIGAPAVPRVVGMLQSKSDDAQLGALKALGAMKGPPAPETVAAVAYCLRGSDSVATVAQTYLMKVGATPQVCNIAASVLEDNATGPNQKRLAAQVMFSGNIDNPVAIHAIDHILRSGDTSSVSAMMTYLNRTRPPDELADALISCIDKGGIYAQTSPAMIASMGSAAMPALRRAATNPSPLTRVSVAQSLGYLAVNDPQAEQLLVHMLDDRDENVVRVVLFSLPGKMWSDAGLSDKALASPKASWRLIALNVLLRQSPPPLERLSVLLDDKDQNIRDTAFKMMQRVVLKNQLVIEKPSATDPVRRARQVRLLSLRDDPDRFGLMTKALKDADAKVRLAAVHTMLDQPTVQMEWDALREAESDPDPEVAAAARRARP